MHTTAYNTDHLPIHTLLECEASVITATEKLIAYAHKHNASDIHLDPQEHYACVRVRIDGTLRTLGIITKTQYPEYVARIKVCAHLRTDEHFAPHDGRFCMVLDTVSIDLRVSIVPTFHGESVVLRLLVPQHTAFSLSDLGFSNANQEILSRAIHKTSGMILVTGPTGSGKTTTLYSLIQQIYAPELSIVTLEDPIEYALHGIKQIPVQQNYALSFSTGLRSVMRQNPDVIMVGEIRDHETAAIAVQTALTGHLLLSTLHTNNAATTLPRLIDMHIEPYLIASTVSLVIGQRLARTICTQCKTSHTLTTSERYYLEKYVCPSPEQYTYVHGAGCAACLGSGFSGRIAFVELLQVTEEIQEMILTRAHTSLIEKEARRSGMKTIREDGFEKVLQGHTSVQELMRVLHE